MSQNTYIYLHPPCPTSPSPLDRNVRWKSGAYPHFSSVIDHCHSPHSLPPGPPHKPPHSVPILFPPEYFTATSSTSTTNTTNTMSTISDTTSTSTHPPALHHLASIRAQADFASRQAEAHFQRYVLARDHLEQLKECEVLGFWARMTLAENRAFVRDEPPAWLKRCAKEVMKVQREIVGEEREMTRWARVERRRHDEYVGGMRAMFP
ncbi:hypothetical protein BKA63DRAFT_157773 [Paraphoma chrysanthemicola]|nr:hypothetical protein BKA63DRAFT_157773 [Paraphoma chrysanthemicola]